jgi:glucokinase
VAIAVYDICAEQLSRALALFIDILNPELIVLGSIYGRAVSLLEPEMLRVIKREALSDSQDACRIVAAGLSENIGDMAALSLAWMSNEN